MMFNDNLDLTHPKHWKHDNAPGEDVLANGGIAYYQDSSVNDGIIKAMPSGQKFVVKISLQDGQETIIRQLS